MPQITETLTNKQIKVYYAIPAGSIVSINPGTSSTVTVEYNVQSVPSSQSNSSFWAVWPKGVLSTVGAVVDVVRDIINLRVTSSGGTCAVNINDSPTQADLELYLRDWQTVENRVLYTNVGGATPAILTNPTVQCTTSVDNYTQIAIQNKSATANSSADLIAYPDNVTSSDLTGFVDIGITSSAYAQASYAVTVANEAYLFGSAPSGASKSGNLIIATDSTGTSNAIKFATGGFNSTANFRAQIDASGLSVTKLGAGLNVKEGSNAKQGLVTLVAGTLVVSNTSVTANSRIFLTSQSVGGTQGFLTVSARTAATSFTILSSNVADTSTVAYQIFEPSV